MHLCLKLLYVFMLSMLTPQAYAQSVLTLLGQDVSLAEISPDEDMLAAYAKNTKISKDMALLQYRHAALTEKILAEVIADYSATHNITALPEWEERFIQQFANLPEDAAAEDISYWQALAERQIKQWLFDKHLFDRYQGTVVFRNNHPQFPVEAYGRLLSEYHEAGRFAINDKQLEALFWQAFRPPFRLEIAPENVDLSVPWWAK